MDKEDSTWHDAQVSVLLTNEKRKKLPMHVGELYNTYLIQIKGDAALYLILNGTKHGFSSYDDFVEMG
jgi:hypothetical protein